MEKKGTNVECEDHEKLVPLHYVCRNGNLHLVAYFVEEHGANIERADNNGATPLHMACQKGHLRVVRYLLEEHAANKDSQANDGWTALHFACRHGHLEVVKYLIQRQGFSVEARTTAGESPLSVARIGNKTEVVNYLNSVVFRTGEHRDEFKDADAATSLQSLGQSLEPDAINQDQNNGTISDFKSWVKENRDSTTSRIPLEEEVKLAMQLYDEANGTNGEDSTSFEEIVTNLRNREIVLDSLVSWKGIHVDWFLNDFCQTPYAKRLIDFGCELWFVRKVCIIELLRRKNVDSGPFVDHVDKLVSLRSSDGTEINPVAPNATVFLSYTGKYAFGHFVELLHELKGEYFWMDMFCTDQFAWTGCGESDTMKVFRKQITSELQDRIAEIKKTVLMLQKWNDVMKNLGKIWVLWEIYNTFEAKASFQILLSAEETNQYLDSLKGTDFESDSIQKSLSSIDVYRARAYDSEGSDIILSLIGERGAYNVSCKVTAMMRLWLIETAEAELTRMRRNGEMDLVFASNLATLLLDQGKLEKAEPLFREVLEARRRLLGDQHPDTLVSISDMGLLLQAQGNLTKAELLLREVLETRLLVLGEQHSDTVISLNHMGLLLQAQGEFTEAEPLLRQAMTTSMLFLGERHPETLVSINNTASLLQAQGKLKEAEPLFREALETKMHVLKSSHVDTLTSMNSMAHLLRAQGKLKEAEFLYREVFETSRRVLGDQHPFSLTSIHNMANLHLSQWKLVAAEPLCQKVLTERRRVLGSDHPDTLSSINSMAKLLLRQGKLLEAEHLCREGLMKRREILGDEHHDTLSSINDMADLLVKQGRLSEAEPYYQESLTKRRQELGDQHPDTLSSINGMAGLLLKQGQLLQAEELYLQVMRDRQRELGEQHPETLSSIKSMANLLMKQRRLSEAEPLFRKALTGRRRVLGNQHPETLSSINTEANLLIDQSKFDEAKPMCKEIQAGRIKQLGREHPDTLASLDSLAFLQVHQDNMSDSEKLCQEVLRGMRKQFGDEHPNTLASMNNLAVVLLHLARLTEAEGLLRKALAGMEKQLGGDCPDALAAMKNLAIVLFRRHSLSEAKKLSGESSQGMRKKLGDNHPLALRSVDDTSRISEDASLAATSVSDGTTIAVSELALSTSASNQCVASTTQRHLAQELELIWLRLDQSESVERLRGVQRANQHDEAPQYLEFPNTQEANKLDDSDDESAMTCELDESSDGRETDVTSTDMSTPLQRFQVDFNGQWSLIDGDLANEIAPYIHHFGVRGIIGLSLARLENSQGDDREAWAADWALKLSMDDPQAWRYNLDRKLCLKFLYRLIDNKLLSGFRPFRVDRIVRTCLVMDRANALRNMIDSRRNTRGLHWFAEVDRARLRDQLEGPEIQLLRKCRATLNRRLRALLDEQELGYRDDAEIYRWMMPVPRPAESAIQVKSEFEYGWDTVEDSTKHTSSDVSTARDNNTESVDRAVLPNVATNAALGVQSAITSEAWIFARWMNQKFQQLHQTDKNNKRKISTIQNEITELSKGLLSVAKMDKLDRSVPFVYPDFSSKRQRLATEDMGTEGFDLGAWLMTWQKLSSDASTLSKESVPDQDELYSSIAKVDHEVQEAVAAVRKSGQDLDAIKKLRGFAQTSEQYKDDICGALGIEAIVQAMRDHADDANVQRESIATLLVLTHQHDLSKLTICELGGIEAICAAIETHKDDPRVAKPACGALWTLAVDNDNNKIFIASNGVLSRILMTMSRHMTDSKIQECCCGVLSVLGRQIGVENQCKHLYGRFKAWTRLGKTELVKAAKREMVLKRRSAFEFLRSRFVEEEDRPGLETPSFETGNETSEQTVAAETLVFHALSEIRSMIVHEGGVKLVLESMRAQELDKEVQYSGLCALSHLSSIESAKGVIAKHDGVDIIIAAIQNHGRSSPRIMVPAEDLIVSLEGDTGIKQEIADKGARQHLEEARNNEEKMDMTALINKLTH